MAEAVADFTAVAVDSMVAEVLAVGADSEAGVDSAAAVSVEHPEAALTEVGLLAADGHPMALGHTGAENSLPVAMAAPGIVVLGIEVPDLRARAV